MNTLSGVVILLLLIPLSLCWSVQERHVKTLTLVKQYYGTQNLVNSNSFSLPVDFSFSVLQMSGSDLNPSQRVEKADRFLAQIPYSSYLVIFPGNYTGFSIDFNISSYQSLASNYSKALSVSGTTIHNGSVHEFTSIIDSEGSLIYTYFKPVYLNSTLIPSSSSQLPVVLLPLSASSSIPIGLISGTDLLFPESSASLMLKGALFVIVSNSFDLPLSQTNITFAHLLKIRSTENVLFSAFATSSEGNDYSMAVNYCWDDNGDESFTSALGCDQGQVLAQGKSGREQILNVQGINFNLLLSYRATQTIWGDAYRRPYHYTPLCYPNINSNPSLDSFTQKCPDTTTTKNNDLKLKIALLQLIPVDSVQGNLETAEAFIRKAMQQNDPPEVVVMSEMWSVGYDIMFPPPVPKPTLSQLYNWTFLANTPPFNSQCFISYFQALSKELNVAIAVSLLHTSPSISSCRSCVPSPPLNTVVLINRFGQVLYSYSKIHTCAWLTDEGLTSPGDSVPSADLELRNGQTIRVGSIICYDREHFETARMASVTQGVEVLLVPNGCWLIDFQIEQLKIRSLENAMIIAMANYANNPNSRNAAMNGRSIIIDERGGIVVEAGKEQQVIQGEVDVGTLRQWRSTGGVGMAVRKIHLHEELCELVRENSFSENNAWMRVGGSTI